MKRFWVRMIFAAAVILATIALAAVPISADDSATGLEKPAPASVAALPGEVDLRPQFTDFGLGPRRQGRRNTCSVFTTAAALEFALSKHEGQGSPLSVEYLNWACNQVIHNKTQDRGQFFHNLLAGFERFGICPESDMPYTRRFDPELKPTDEAVGKAHEIRTEDFTIHWINPWKKQTGLTDEQFREIKQVLSRGWPVAAGASHSRLLVGYTDDPEQPGGGIFLTKDSGKGAFSRVTYEFVKERVGDVYWVEAPNAPK